MKNCIAIVFVFSLFSCNQQKIDTKAEGEKVMQISKEWSDIASSGDIEKTLNYWAEDAILISAGEGTLNGKNEIRQMVEQSYKIPGFKISWQPISVQVSESGDMAYLLEDSQVSYTDSSGNTMTQYNQAVSIWRKQSDGTWKNVVDISTPGNK
ncbi:SgcJ/EcaC family oxidoreductase [Algoriphagus sp.]|uniref:YybH family protein n=1 Tax=Algoriphagus sp. TaxID=1872435 RepID=UPI0025D60130|nr:SgcJ/EcaC family oxidoreductase [Algoriphagus sp.]